MRWPLRCSGVLILVILAWLVAPSRTQAVFIPVMAPVNMPTPAISKELRSIRGAAKTAGRDFSYSVSLDIQEMTPEPDPEPVPELLVRHGPAVIEKEVLFGFPCEDSVTDLNENLWNFTSQLYLYDPNGNEVTPRPAPHWVHEKMSMQSSHSWNLTDPLEGEYTCKSDFYVDSTYLGQAQNKKTLTYIVPTGETTSGNGWAGQSGWSTMYKWGITLTTNNSANFKGRVVTESDGGGADDTCYYDGAPVFKADSLTGPWNALSHDWTVGNGNTWGDDIIGWFETSVAHYRAAGRAHNDGCGFVFTQVMSINRPGNSDAAYKSHQIKGSFTDTLVRSERDGNLRTKAY